MRAAAALWRRVTNRLTERQRAGAAGFGWSATAQLIGIVVRLASSLILTRLLAPDAYGLLGTAMTVLTVLDWVSDWGVIPALVRHPRGDEREYLDTGWWMGLARGAALAAAAALAAWPLALFYRRPELAGILIALALRPLLTAFRSPDWPLARRRMNWRALAIDEALQTIVGTAVSVLIAVLFRSVWSIVGGTLAGAVTTVVLSYAFFPRRPGGPWCRAALADLNVVGRQVFLNTLVMALWMNLDRLAGLRLVSAAELGVYWVAFNLAAVAEGLVGRGCEVYFTMLAREPPEARPAFHRHLRARAVAFGAPALVIAALLCPFAVQLIYDSRYHAAGPLLALLLARLVIRAAGQLDFQYLLVDGNLRPATVGYAVALGVQAAILWPLVQTFGVAGLPIGALAATAVMTGVQVGLQDRDGSGRRAFGVALSWAMLVTIWVVATWN